MGVRRSNPKRPQQQHNSKVNMKIIALAISLASLVHGEGLFVSNALDGVEIKLRGRDRGPDITQVELHIRPKEVSASGQIPTLEYKEEDGCWKEAAAKAGPTKRGQKKRWRLDLPAPCKTYKFRFALRSDSCIEYLEHPKSMGGSVYTWWNKPDSSLVPRKIYRWAATTP